MRYAPPLVKMKVLNAIEFASDACIRDKIKKAAEIVYVDNDTGISYQFTWRTISTWFYHYKLAGSEVFQHKKRKDIGAYRKISPEELASGISLALESLPKQKSMFAMKTIIYRWLLENQFFNRSQLSPTTFYRFVRERELLKPEQCKKLQLSFCMAYPNDMWQGDTMHCNILPDGKGKFKKIYFIGLIDDSSKLIPFAAFYHTEKIQDLTHALKMAIYCRGIPKVLYFDNGSVYRSKTIIDACVRLNIRLSHTKVRDAAAKGKIERLNQTIQNDFMKIHDFSKFKNIEQLNVALKDWISKYNSRIHSSIQMTPEQRFAIDISRVRYLDNSEFNDEIFYTESIRIVTKTNTFSLHGKTYECPADLREKEAELRYDPRKPETVIVYYKQRRLGKAGFLNLTLNSTLQRESRFSSDQTKPKSTTTPDKESNNQVDQNQNNQEPRKEI